MILHVVPDDTTATGEPGCMRGSLLGHPSAPSIGVPPALSGSHRSLPVTRLIVPARAFFSAAPAHGAEHHPQGPPRRSGHRPIGRTQPARPPAAARGKSTNKHRARERRLLQRAKGLTSVRGRQGQRGAGVHPAVPCRQLPDPAGSPAQPRRPRGKGQARPKEPGSRTHAKDGFYWGSRRMRAVVLTNTQKQLSCAKITL